MKYRVIEGFTDLQDNNRKYAVGDQFPRDGLQVSDRRLDELLTSKNRRQRPMIEAVEEAPEEVPVVAPVEAPTKDPEEYVSEVKEEARDIEAGVRPSKTSKTKRSTKKG